MGNQHTPHNCYSIKNMLKLLVFIRVLNELLLETEWSEVIIIWWFGLIKFIRSFLTLFSLISLFKRFPLQLQLHWKNCPFSIYRYHYGSTVLFSLRFCFTQTGTIFYFSFVNFLNKIAKPNCKTPFIKLRKDYICYIFLI